MGFNFVKDQFQKKGNQISIALFCKNQLIFLPCLSLKYEDE
jgi:hypothetical protein